MSDTLVCKMPNCGGTLGNDIIPLQTGCYSTSPCRACTTCGRVHSYEGYLMFNRPGSSLYLRNDKLELVLEPISFEISETYLSRGYLFVYLDDSEEIPEMVNVDPETPLIYDGMSDDMFRFHGEDGKKYLLHRGDVNFIEKKQ